MGLLLTVTALALGSASSPAFASGGDAQLAAGLQKFEEGRRAFEAGQFEAALGAFKTSLELLPSPNTRLYIGRCYRAIGKTASAYTSLRRAATEAQDRMLATKEARYGATRDTATQEAAALEPKVPRLTVAVPSNTPPDFAVKVDGSELPKAAWGIATEVDPGTVEVEASGHRLVPFKKSVALGDGARERVDVVLLRVPTATLTLKLSSLPSGLALALDGHPIEVAGVDAPRELDVGAHVLTATAPGYLPFKWSQPLADAQTQVVDVTLAPNLESGARHTPKWLFFTAAGAAVASAGVATGLAVHAESQQSQQTALAPNLRDPNVQRSIQLQATLTDVLFTAGGVFAAGAAVLVFTTGWTGTGNAATALSVAPWVGPASGGMGAHGTF